MPFPDTPRVLYAINPLDEVICQLRFPVILKIDAEPPAAFQEFVRTDYPHYETKQNLKLPPGIPRELIQSVLAELPLGGRVSHSFGSRDGDWKLTLNRQAMALNCGVYDRWEKFKERLVGPFDALMRSYAPGFFSRIGLRYRNVIRRSRIGMGDTSWSELLKPWVSGVFQPSGIENEVFGTQTVCDIRLPDNLGQVHVTFGLAIEERPGEDTRTVEREEVFLIDSDFFVEQETEPTHVINRLDALHRQGNLLFHWCITDRLHAALRPEPMPPV